MVMLALLRTAAPVAVRAVTVAAAGVTPPTVILSRVPKVAGAIVTTPVPVGERTTLWDAGDSVTVFVALRVPDTVVVPLSAVVLDAASVVNAPVDGELAPIVLELIVLVVIVALEKLFAPITASIKATSASTE